MAEAIELIGNRVALIGAIVSGVVALNTMVTGCVETDQSRYRYFETAVKSEESFYKGLFDDYIEASGKSIEPDERLARMLAIRTMANRPVPTFDEVKIGLFQDSASLKRAAAEHIKAMQSSLLAATASKEANGATIANAAQLESYGADEKVSLRARTGGVVTPEAQAKTATAAAASAIVSSGAETYQAKVLSAGSPTGWDVDVFWCAGGNEAARVRDAGLAASALATAANAKTQVMPGITYGRIRLRPLPEALQGPRSYAGRGYRVVFDNAPGEANAAKAVLATINSGAPTQFTPGLSATPTKWYISVFVCPAAASSTVIPAG